MKCNSVEIEIYLRIRDHLRIVIRLLNLFNPGLFNWCYGKL